MTGQNSMILVSGFMLILWTTYKWQTPHIIWNNKWYCLYSRMLGSYNIILVTISKFCKIEIPIIFLVVDFVLLLMMDMGFVVTKIKKARKGNILNIQLGICIFLIFYTLAMTCLDVNDVAFSIAGLCGTMMLISISFE